MSIINVFWQMKAAEPLDLEWLQWSVTDAKLYTGRPHMLSWKSEHGRVQFFPNGSIQLIGNISDSQAMKLYKIIRQLVEMEVSMPSIKNIVLRVKLSKRQTLSTIPSNKDITYNSELFPAALITRWHPAHVSVFQSGEAIVTGVKSKEQASNIISDVDNFLDNFCARFNHPTPLPL